MTPAADARDARLTKGQRTRERLLEVALRLFAEKGYEGVGTREVAAAAETNIASIAFHFAGKEGLYEAVIERVADELAGLHRTALALAQAPDAATEDAGELVRRIVEKLVTALLTSNRSQWMSLLLQREFITPTASFQKIYDTAIKPSLEAFSNLVGEATGHGARTLDNKVLSFSIFIMASAFARNKNTFLHFAGSPDRYAPGDIETVSRVVAGFVKAGLAPR